MIIDPSIINNCPIIYHCQIINHCPHIPSHHDHVWSTIIAASCII
jgi:hypothetical protein